MNKLIINYRMVLFVYGSILVTIGSIFLLKDVQALSDLHYNLPLIFLLKFSIFWLMCFLIAVAGFLLYLSSNQLLMARPDKAYAARLGRLAFFVGLTGGTLALVSLLTLRP